jgi:hypothetical protein
MKIKTIFGMAAITVWLAGAADFAAHLVPDEYERRDMTQTIAAMRAQADTYPAREDCEVKRRMGVECSPPLDTAAQAQVFNNLNSRMQANLDKIWNEVIDFGFFSLIVGLTYGVISGILEWVPKLRSRHTA